MSNPLKKDKSGLPLPTGGEPGIFFYSGKIHNITIGPDFIMHPKDVDTAYNSSISRQIKKSDIVRWKNEIWAVINVSDWDVSLKNGTTRAYLVPKSDTEHVQR